MRSRSAAGQTSSTAPLACATIEGMHALAAICIQTGTHYCPPGSTRITPIQLLVGAFVLVAVLGFLWLGRRSRGGF